MNKENSAYLAIVASFVVVAALAGYYLGQYMFQTVPHGFLINLTAQSAVNDSGLTGATADATFDPASGRMLTEVVLPTGKSLPQGSFMEGWLVASGGAAPYWLSTGKINSVNRGGRYLNFFLTENTLNGYDKIAITLENDQDPHPSSQVLFEGNVK